MLCNTILYLLLVKPSAVESIQGGLQSTSLTYCTVQVEVFLVLTKQSFIKLVITLFSD